MFARPIERLMYLAVLLILGCDCTNDEMETFRHRFERQLSDYDLDQLLSEIPKMEARIFRSHLRSIDENFQIRDKNKSAV